MKAIIRDVMRGLHQEYDNTLLFIVLVISVWLTVWSLSNNHKEAATAIQRLTDATAGALFALLAGNRKKE